MDVAISLRWQSFVHALESNLYGYLITLFFCVLLISAAVTSQGRGTSGPPSLWDPVPFVFNTVQFLTNNHKFMTRVTYILSCFYAYPYILVLLSSSCLTYQTQRNT
jgi:preprotein translocase subunit SecG